jgi:hypothetical protein
MDTVLIIAGRKGNVLKIQVDNFKCPGSQDNGWKILNMGLKQLGRSGKN